MNGNGSGNGSRPPRRNPAGRSCLLVLMAAVLAAAGLTASAASASTARPAESFPCGFFDQSYNMAANPPYGQADIESNPCNLQMRVHIQYVLHGLTFDAYSGWVEALELNAKAVGASNSFGTFDEVQQENDGGGSRMCEEFYPAKGGWHPC